MRAKTQRPLSLPLVHLSACLQCCRWRPPPCAPQRSYLSPFCNREAPAPDAGASVTFVERCGNKAEGELAVDLSLLA